MQYTELGKTGINVSRLGFGAMRLPMADGRITRELAIPMIHKAFDAGVNYIDTAIGYCNQDSQRVVGEALEGWRDKVTVSTKNHFYDDEKEWWDHLHDSLEKLQVDSIDIYRTHGVNAKKLKEAVEPRVMKWMTKARDQGLIKHICTSFHDNNEALIEVIDSGFYASILLQYNMLDRQLEEGMAYAKEKGVGVEVMGPVGGGSLGVPNDVFSSVVASVKRVPELAMRFALANPNVDTVFSGMSTMDQVVENLLVSSDETTLSEEEQEAISKHLDRLKKMADLYCTGCDYCKPCPQDVNISRVFSTYNSARVHGFRDKARASYSWWKDKQPEGGMQADACTECGQCEEKCPQNIAIRKQLKESHAELTQ
jgi:predicted aldo/keto reductase-like oxidoreductase